MSLADCRLIDIPEVTTHVGSLCFAESNRSIPFDIRRIYYLYNMFEGVSRGFHAHVKLEQVLIAISGSMDVMLDDGNDKTVFHIGDPAKGSYIGPMVWRELSNFSESAVCLSLASEIYDELDYIRDYDKFVTAVWVSQQ